LLVHGSTVLYRIDREGKNLETIIGEGGVVSSFTFDQQQKCMAYFYGEMDNPGQIYVRYADRVILARLTSFNEDWLSAEVDLGEMEEVWFKGPDGNDLQGWILKPPGFDPNQKYPSILEIHGGPLTHMESSLCTSSISWPRVATSCISPIHAAGAVMARSMPAPFIPAGAHTTTTT
jgi:dipeptidyl aminopeptidase/acylaminoacyl peptidase